MQQTRAADAAYEIVGLTYNQSLMMLAGTIFGLLTLVAAFAAVLYAKRAADAAKDTLDHQKETSRRQLRPYVYIGEARLTLPFSSKSKVTLDIKNFGLSPAVNIKSGMRNSLVTRPIGEQARDLEMIEWEDMPVLGPQGDNQLHVGLTEFDADDIFDIECGAIALVAHHAITYEDLDGNKDGHDAWFYIDKNTLVDGVVMTLNEWARYNSHREPEGDNPELELKRGK